MLKRHLPTVLGVSAGVLASTLLSRVAWGDAPAPVGLLVVAGGVAVLSALWRGGALPILAWVAVAFLGLLSSAALGSTWAVLTWSPVLMAAFLMGRVLPGFVPAMVFAALLRDAPTIVVLTQSMAAQSMSGSTQYFLGLLGVIGAPLAFGLAVRLVKAPKDRWLVILGAAGASLGIWTALLSGSRAVELAGLVATAASAVLLMVDVNVLDGWRARLRRGAVAASLTVALVFVWDLGLSATFGDGGSLVLDARGDGLGTVITQASGDAPNSTRTRLALWRQAATIALDQPTGYGPGSYGHVNHAYQEAPMLWSGSPHSVWALAAVELGWPGLAVLLGIVAGGLLMALRRQRFVAASLLAATAVMSLDVFSSMPYQSLVWWALLGMAWGPSAVPAKSRARRWSALALALASVAAVAFALRFAAPCEDACVSVDRFGGHPRFVSVAQASEASEDGPNWEAWRSYYPLAFWLRSAEARHGHGNSPRAMHSLVQSFPFQSPELYVEVAETVDDQLAVDVAMCGLERFFGGQAIWRDWRSSQDEMNAVRARLEAIAGTSVGGEESCARADIPAFSFAQRD